MGVEQSAIKAFAFSLEKQNPFFPRFEYSTLDTKPFNMFKLCILSVLLTIVCAAPAPTPGAVLAAPAAIAAVPALSALPAPIVTASSSQVVARNYNTLAAAPLAAAPISPIAYAHYAATPLAAYGTHAIAPAAYAAYSAPVLL
ncbi:uncharacterized protein LOC112458263 [Temnothorax curvispinosus]|uniref:Uncharacterized protein LOC112458263 n=2 Tax=Temnothorax TaxID=300110 RepID=A0A6J1Q9R7_9HYME|nr:uncharacterized protein LOC112458263 [Temnothorax curvispinosus]TGZ48691.1 Uncharacterized protein DBV15_09749 [Temnothorax longispinosus]